MSDIGLDNATLKATRPASRWRNKYLALRTQKNTRGKTLRPGEKDWGDREWPSRDIAETHGLTSEANYPDYYKYLGAFPVDA